MPMQTVDSARFCVTCMKSHQHSIINYDAELSIQVK